MVTFSSSENYWEMAQVWKVTKMSWKYHLGLLQMVLEFMKDVKVTNEQLDQKLRELKNWD